MTSFWAFFIQKKAFTYLLIATLVAVGTFSLFSIPKESAPEVKVPVGIVTTILPGASAEDTEKLVTNKIEDEVANIDNLDKMTSSSKEGVSSIAVQFLASADIDKSIQDLKDAVDRAKASLPSEAKDPFVAKVSFSSQPILIVSVSADVPASDLVVLGDDLKDQIKTVPGVSDVTVSGVRERETAVVVNKEALNTYGLKLTDVIGALQAANASTPIGSIEVDSIDYAVKFNGSIDNPKDVGDIALTTINGTPIYVRDVALVTDGLQKATTFSRVSINSAPSEQALTLNVIKRTGGDITKITSAVKAKIEELKKTELAGSQVLVTFDAGDEVQKNLTDLTRVGIETVVLVMLMLFLTIGWRESVVAGLSIPLSFLMAFVGLLLSGNTLNFVSLFSLILAIGILVDSGIVVTEAIHTRYKKYGDASQAAVASIKEYGWPLIAGTMSTVAFFVPLFFLSGITGQFIKSIPFTIIFVLIASIFVALGIVPLIAILFTKRSQNKFEQFQEKWNDKAREWYKHFLHGVLDNARFQKRFLWAIGIAFVIALFFPVIGLVQVTFFPQEDVNYMYIELTKPEGTPLLYTDQAIRQVEDVLYDQKKYPEIESFVTTVGAGSAFNDSAQSGSKIANITINLKDKKDRSRTSSQVVASLRKDLADIRSADITVSEPNSGPPTGAAVEIKVTGTDFADLNKTIDAVEHLLQGVPGTVNVRTSNTSNGNQFALTVDRAKASQLGLNPAIIAQTLRTAVNGVTATTIRLGSKDVDVVVKLNLNNADNNPDTTTHTTVDAIRQIPIQTPNGPILLGSVLTATLESSSATISHENKKRIMTVSSDLLPGHTSPEISTAFNAKKSELTIPKGVTVAFSGENDEIAKTFKEMFLALGGGMLLVLMVLVLVFNSFRYTGYLLIIVPLSLIGVMIGLAVSFQPLSFPSMLGIIALAGVIINHAIILLDSMVHALNARTGQSLKDIVIESAATRLRPIVLTTITTVIGMIPLTTASALWGPIAWTIMFGLTFSMVLSLVFIPVLFYRSPKVRKIHGSAQ